MKNKGRRSPSGRGDRGEKKDSDDSTHLVGEKEEACRASPPQSEEKSQRLLRKGGRQQIVNLLAPGQKKEKEEAVLPYSILSVCEKKKCTIVFSFCPFRKGGFLASLSSPCRDRRNGKGTYRTFYTNILSTREKAGGEKKKGRGGRTSLISTY